MNLKKIFDSRKVSDGVNEDIKRYKKSLISKAKKNGIYENFGQKEVQVLQDKYGYTADVADFDNWCMDFDMSYISDSVSEELVYYCDARIADFKEGEVGDELEYLKSDGPYWSETEAFDASLDLCMELHNEFPNHSFFVDIFECILGHEDEGTDVDSFHAWYDKYRDTIVIE